MNKQKNSPKKVDTTKKVDKDNMRTRSLSQGEIFLVRVGLAVIVITVAIILGIVLVNSFNRSEAALDPLEDFTHITAVEITPLIGFDQETGIYGDFSFFNNSTNETYQKIDGLLDDTATSEVHILFYRSQSLDASVEETLLELFETLDTKAFFVLDLDAAVNQTLFDNQTLQNAGILTGFDLQILTFYIEGQILSNNTTVYYEVWRDVRNILITLNKI